MGIDKFNPEGYFDPTAYEALTAIEKEEKIQRAFRHIVYICSPFAGSIQRNIESARRYSRFAIVMGCIPIAPHLLFPQFLDDSDPDDRKLGLFFGNVLMSKCDEIWVFGDYISSGMRSEISLAKQRNYNIRYFNTKCEEVNR